MSFIKRAMQLASSRQRNDWSLRRLDEGDTDGRLRHWVDLVSVDKLLLALSPRDALTRSMLAREALTREALVVVKQTPWVDNLSEYAREAQVKIIEAIDKLSRRLAEEAKALVDCQSPFTLKLLWHGPVRHTLKGVGIELDGYAIVTKYYAEGDLFDFCYRSLGDMNSEDRDQFVMNTARRLVSAVAHMHSQNYVHRDIKPENCFLDKGLVVLGDFGFASKADKVALDRIEEGTILYMSPELAQRQKRYQESLCIVRKAKRVDDVRVENMHALPWGDWRAVDMYALGVTLHNALCQSSITFGAGTQLFAYMGLKLDQDLVIDLNKNKLPEGLYKLIKQMTMTSQEDRITAQDALVQIHTQ